MGLHSLAVDKPTVVGFGSRQSCSVGIEIIESKKTFTPLSISLFLFPSLPFVRLILMNSQFSLFMILLLDGQVRLGKCQNTGTGKSSQTKPISLLSDLSSSAIRAIPTAERSKLANAMCCSSLFQPLICITCPEDHVLQCSTLPHPP